MTREERIDWLCRLRSWVVAPPLMTAEQKSKFIEALTETIEALQTEQNAYKEGYDACKHIMAREKNFNHYCPKCMGKLEPCEDCISRQAVDDYISQLLSGYLYDEERERLEQFSAWLWDELPSVQQEQKVKPISYQDCANAMLMMWIDKVLTDGEYYRIMDKLNAHEKKMKEGE